METFFISVPSGCRWRIVMKNMQDLISLRCRVLASGGYKGWERCRGNLPARTNSANQTQLRLAVPSSRIGVLMGKGGATIQRFQHSHQSSIKVSGQRIFLPDATEDQGRVIHCSAPDQSTSRSATVL
jgi:hypothetical protein